MSLNPFEGYRITSSFGYRIHPISGGQTFHRGVDLVTEPWNGPVNAFMDGTVRFAAEGVTGSGFGGYGLTVAIEDHKGYLHCYAHLSRIKVKLGQQVKQGQMIGNQGSTGESTGPHVHYEVRKSSTPSYGYTPSENGVVDPGVYLQSAYSSANGETREMLMTADEKKRFIAMERTLEVQSAWIQQQKKISDMACPPWAEEAYHHYQSFMMNDTGSYDFWRMLVIMYRKEKGIKVSPNSQN